MKKKAHETLKASKYGIYREQTGNRQATRKSKKMKLLFMGVCEYQ